MALANPWKSYRQVALQTAPPGQLVLLLYEGAIRFLERSLTGFAQDDPAQCNATISNNVLRAQDILRELDGALNVGEGGPLAQTLRGLYQYFDRRLTQSNLRKEAEGIQEVLQRLTVLRDAWAAMLRGEGQASPTMIAPLVAA